MIKNFNSNSGDLWWLGYWGPCRRTCVGEMKQWQIRFPPEIPLARMLIMSLNEFSEVVNGWMYWFLLISLAQMWLKNPSKNFLPLCIFRGFFVGKGIRAVIWGLKVLGKRAFKMLGFLAIRLDLVWQETLLIRSQIQGFRDVICQNLICPRSRGLLHSQFLWFTPQILWWGKRLMIFGLWKSLSRWGVILFLCQSSIIRFMRTGMALCTSKFYLQIRLLLFLNLELLGIRLWVFHFFGLGKIWFLWKIGSPFRAL